MPDDEFFKRIAEAQVQEEPADDRPLGTAARRMTRAKTTAPRDPGEAGEQPSADTVERSRSPEPRRRKAEPLARLRGWNGRRVAAICGALGAIAAVTAGAVSVLGGLGKGGSSHGAQIVVEFSPRFTAPVKPRHVQAASPRPNGKPRDERDHRRHPPVSVRQAAGPVSEIPHEPATSAPVASLGTREGFGIERGR